MRAFVMMTALIAISACNRSGDSSNNVAGNQAEAPAVANAQAANATAAPAVPANAAAPVAAGGYPPDFPSNDRDDNAVHCYVFLSLSMAAPGASTGFDDAAMGQARDQWRSDLRQRMTETETQQLIASSVNPLTSTPAAQRDAASRWCVPNAPEVDPDR